VTQATPPLTQFYIICLEPLTILLHAKFGVSSFTRSGDMVGSQNLKIRSRDPGHAPLWELYIFY